MNEELLGTDETGKAGWEKDAGHDADIEFMPDEICASPLVKDGMVRLYWVDSHRGVLCTAEVTEASGGRPSGCAMVPLLDGLEACDIACSPDGSKVYILEHGGTEEDQGRLSVYSPGAGEVP